MMMNNSPIYRGNVPPPPKPPRAKKIKAKIKKTSFQYKIRLENSRLREQNDSLKKCLDLLLRDANVSQTHICENYAAVRTLFGFNVEDLFKDI